MTIFLAEESSFLNVPKASIYSIQLHQRLQRQQRSVNFRQIPKQESIDPEVCRRELFLTQSILIQKDLLLHPKQTNETPIPWQETEHSP